MSNIVHVNFSKFTILQSYQSQLIPYKIIEDAMVAGPPESLYATIDKIRAASPRDTMRIHIWHIYLLDSAINSDLLIRFNDGTPARNDEYIFHAVKNMGNFVESDEQVWLFDSATEALEAAARKRLS